VSNHLYVNQPGPTSCKLFLAMANCLQSFFEIDMLALASLEPALDATFAQTFQSQPVGQ
jgi:hypothetical protein